MNPFKRDMLDGYYEQPLPRRLPAKQEEEKKEEKPSDFPLYLVIVAFLLILTVLGSAF